MMDNDQEIGLLASDGLAETNGNCARCGEDHPIAFRKFKKHAVKEYEYWANCPVLDEPILIRVIPGGNVTE